MNRKLYDNSRLIIKKKKINFVKGKFLLEFFSISNLKLFRFDKQKNILLKRIKISFDILNSALYKNILIVYKCTARKDIALIKWHFDIKVFFFIIFILRSSNIYVNKEKDREIIIYTTWLLCCAIYISRLKKFKSTHHLKWIF